MSATLAVPCSTASETVESRRILGIPIHFLNFQEVFQEVLSWRENKEKGYVVFANPHSILSCFHDDPMKMAHSTGRMVLADGIGVILATLFLFGRRIHRVQGPDLMKYIFAQGSALGLRHYLFGGSPDVVQVLARQLQAEFPHAIICGSYSPPYQPQFTSEDNQHFAKMINQARPDIVWVGLGAPKQEKWMAEVLSLVNAPALFGVGAAFDFISGSVPRAPRWMIRIGFEWAYRLTKEPQRLWRRTFESIIFVFLVFGQKFRPANS